jgi:hypothetical protein
MLRQRISETYWTDLTFASSFPGEFDPHHRAAKRGTADLGSSASTRMPSNPGMQLDEMPSVVVIGSASSVQRRARRADSTAAAASARLIPRLRNRAQRVRSKTRQGVED